MLFVNYSGAVPAVTLPGGAEVGSSSPPGTVIQAGTYTIQISVSSGPADFQIVGPGVNFLDNEPSTEVYTVTFAPSSTYAFEDVTDPAATLGYFSTSASSAPGPPATNSSLSTTPQTNSDVVGSEASSPRPAKLEAVVSRQGIASLTDNGRPLSRLSPGRHTFGLDDQRRATRVFLQERGRSPETLIAASSALPRSVTVTLGAGTWFYYTTPTRKTVFVVGS
jgi:hypothetical protein